MPTSPESSNILLAAGIFVTTTISLISAWLLHDRKIAKAQLQENTKDIVKLKETAVTEDTVREIISKELSPLSAHMIDLKMMVTKYQEDLMEIKLKIAHDDAYRQAYLELTKEKKND